MALLDEFKALAPERVADGDTRLNLFIGYASLRINRRVFGSKADFATVLLAAHMATRFSSDADASSSGSMTMEKVGDMQVQMQALQMKGDEELSTTTYGAMFAQLRKGLLTSPMVV